MSGHVGGGGGFVISGERLAAVRREREQFEKELQELAMRPVTEATERAARAHGQLIAEEKNLAIAELKVKLTTHPVAFKTTAYTGNDSAESITQMIGKAFDEFKAQVTELDAAFTAKVMAVSYMNPIDSTKVQSWLDLLTWIGEQFAALEASYAAPVEAPVTPITVDPYATVRQEIADLRAKAEKCAFDSKERNDLERRAYQLETKLEVLGDGDYLSIMQEIIGQSGKSLSSAHNLKFRQWLSLPVQVRKYGANPTAQNIRFAFAEFTNSGDSFLTPEEKIELSRRQTVAAMSSQDVKRAVGNQNTYDPTGHGYRAGRQ